MRDLEQSFALKDGLQQCFECKQRNYSAGLHLVTTIFAPMGSDVLSSCHGLTQAHLTLHPQMQPALEWQCHTAAKPFTAAHAWYRAPLPVAPKLHMDVAMRPYTSSSGALVIQEFLRGLYNQLGVRSPTIPDRSVAPDSPDCQLPNNGSSGSPAHTNKLFKRLNRQLNRDEEDGEYRPRSQPETSPFSTPIQTHSVLSARLARPPDHDGEDGKCRLHSHPESSSRMQNTHSSLDAAIGGASLLSAM
jgi:hypothetical protein